MKKLTVAMALCALGVMGGLASSAAVPDQASAGNQRYYSDTVPGNSQIWTRNANGSLQWALRDWGSIYHNGGGWSNGFRNYQSGLDAYQSTTTGSPVQWNNPWSNKTGATTCWNKNASGVFANCWTTNQNL